MLVVLGYGVYGLFQPTRYVDVNRVIPHPEDYDSIEDKFFMIIEMLQEALSDPSSLSEDEADAILEDIPRVALPGGMTVLPTPGVPETQEKFDENADRVTTLASYLMALLMDGAFPENSTDEAWLELEWLLLLLDMMTNLENETSQTPIDENGRPQFLSFDAQKVLGLDDMFGSGGLFPVMGQAGYGEPQMELVDPIGFPFLRVIWSNLWPPGFIDTKPMEDVIVTDPIPLRACVSITKEKKGIVPVVVTTKVPIWVKPLFGDRSIVGETYVWVLWWVPAEFIKTITYCNPTGSGITQTITQKLILEWAQGHLWWYYVNQ